MKVDFYRHGLTPSAADDVAKVLATPFLTSGAVSRNVEAQLCEFFGAEHALLVNSWTNGAIAVLMALGIGPGDEVIMPAMTFVATANVVEIVGAKPVFVDVDPATCLMTPQAARKAVTARTKAVLPVHLYGQMIDMRALRDALADCGNIAIVEDCAHCFEGRYGGHRPGVFSTAALFSFYATKNVTCGEGGAIITNDSNLHALTLQTRLHGMSAGAVDRFKAGGYRHWDVERLGTKANLPDLLASLLPAQIRTIESGIPRRAELVQAYEAGLRGLPIRYPSVDAAALHARHLFPIHVAPEVRDDALRVLAENGISCTVNYRSVPTLSFYRKKYGYGDITFPISHRWGAGTITLPFFPSLTRDEQDYVIAILRDRIAPMIIAAEKSPTN